MNNSVISVNVNNAGNFIDAIDNFGTVNIKRSTINITANAGAYTGMYGIDNAVNSTLNLDGVNINVVATNVLNPLLISGLNGNNSTAIMNYNTIAQFMLPNENIHFFGNTKISNLVWSKELCNNLPTTLKNSIKTFMMYNKTMTTFKIPYCVLNMVFTYLIN